MDEKLDKYYVECKIKVRIDRYPEFLEYIKKFGTIGVDKETFTDKNDAEMVSSLIKDKDEKDTTN
jgi:hypothetical protein